MCVCVCGTNGGRELLDRGIIIADAKVEIGKALYLARRNLERKGKNK